MVGGGDLLCTDEAGLSRQLRPEIPVFKNVKTRVKPNMCPD